MQNHVAELTRCLDRLGVAQLDLGKQVVLVDQRPALGGVCLNIGCIPSKALLHAAKVIAETREMAGHGLRSGDPQVDLDALRGWKDGVVSRLTSGLAGLARQRKVTTIGGTGRFLSMNQVGSPPMTAALRPSASNRPSSPSAPGGSACRSSRTTTPGHRLHRALDLRLVPWRLPVIRGGISGLEMATVCHELGARITVVELMGQLIPGTDANVVRPLAKQIGGRYENVYLRTKVTAVEAGSDGLRVSFEGPAAPGSDVFDQVLVTVGRVPSGRLIGAEAAGLAVDDRGYIHAGKQQRTNVPPIFAIGDIVGQPMLARKATREGKVAAEVATGQPGSFRRQGHSPVACTDPEVAWAGVTEIGATTAGVKYGKGTVPGPPAAGPCRLPATRA